MNSTDPKRKLCLLPREIWVTQHLNWVLSDNDSTYPGEKVSAAPNAQPDSSEGPFLVNSFLDDAEQVVEALRRCVHISDLGLLQQVDVKLLDVEAVRPDRQQLEGDASLGQIARLLRGLLLQTVAVAVRVVIAGEL